ncbi:lipoprotein signal peptidase [Olivibacter sitiensis]|uniref:lipoprotein signal peptidase n=1 Tax=Olivibacter sitiensis TaxID=376470 RepID=UPI000402ACF5|nr:lipoprotein signal peptidase [Olivibacter sitiensis]
MKAYTKPIGLILAVLIVDQAIKFWVKLNMTLGQEYHLIKDRAIIHFTENNGMAFGMELGGDIGKLALSIFRILAILGIGYGLHYMIQRKYNRSLILCVALIFAGAMGNIIDSTFYGVIFSESTWYQKAVLFPAAGGYSSLLHGKVVDMFYFPIIQGHFPQWFPFWGGEDFVFFRPVFNFADSAISVGVALILIFQKKYFKEDVKEPVSYNSEIVEE